MISFFWYVKDITFAKLFRQLIVHLKTPTCALQYLNCSCLPISVPNQFFSIYGTQSSGFLSTLYNLCVGYLVTSLTPNALYLGSSTTPVSCSHFVVCLFTLVPSHELFTAPLFLAFTLSPVCLPGLFYSTCFDFLHIHKTFYYHHA